MGSLNSSSPFFRPGPPAPVGAPDPEILAQLARRVEGTALDVGGGLGAYAIALRDLGHSVALAEIDPDGLRSAREHRLTAYDMRIVSWGSPELIHDTVIMIDVLEHVEQPMEFLRSALQCARRKVVFSVPCNDGFETLFSAGLTYNHVAVSDHRHQFTTQDIRDMLQKLGVSGQIEPVSYLFPDAIMGMIYKAMWRSIRGKIALSSLRVFHKLGKLPRLFPSRILVEIRTDGLPGR